MPLLPVKISFYSGGRGLETPRVFIKDGVTHTVTRLLEERLVQDRLRRQRKEYKVLVEGGGVFLLVVIDGEGYLYQEEY